MNTYKVFSNPIGKSEAVKQGWSWPGFFFSSIWALFKRMWLLGIALIVMSMAFSGISTAIESQSGSEAAMVWDIFTFLIELAIAILFGSRGHQWREKNLLSRGFDYEDTLNANNPEAALALWLKQSQRSRS